MIAILEGICTDDYDQKIIVCQGVVHNGSLPLFLMADKVF